MKTNFKRKTDCGLITKKLLKKTISLAGWVNKRRDFGNLIFIDLRDRSGIMQLVFNPDINKDAHRKAHELRLQYVIGVTGMVVERSPDTINPDLPTGNVELQVHELIIFNAAKTLPFQLDQIDEVDEELRLKYRYLELRTPHVQERFALRSKLNLVIREFFIKQGFYEIETPCMTKSTPEGARDYIVPSRIKHGSFYALAQSPQLYKELLMAAGFEKYFQIARCFRDEDLRADRQPEFTQLDIEMSFIDEHDIQKLIEELFAHVWKQILNKDLVLPFARLTYEEAFALYGSDKPDIRFDLKITDCTALFADTKITFLRSILDKEGKLGAIHLRGHELSRKELSTLEEESKILGAKGLLWIRFKQEQPESVIAKFLPEDFFSKAQKIFPTIADGSILLLIAGAYTETWQLLGKLRLRLAQKFDLIPHDRYSFVWIIDFPLFEWDQETKRWTAVHHPFTQPKTGWENQEPGQMKARSYDLALNGFELGGGSIRIHNAQIQKKVFELLGIPQKEVQEKFGFLLEAQELGFPPLGGIAFGLDRIAMIMTGTKSLRDVIAFPKTNRAVDLVMDAPSPISEKQLKEYGLFLKDKKK
ncbi:aspartate--tRNA ligase [Candidatus Dependentiae bacterium]|nr:MAG: aspartate--tRNA ligase [Candidatus Dependentiae bacterium]